MVTATFRFHQELNDFLPRDRRERSFAAECARQATTKHMIEALGVPHTEVQALLVNGEPSGFERIVAEGDHVVAYARCSQAGQEEMGDALRARPRERMRFVADSHLGGLARLLRMAGYDTLYDNHYHDDEVEALATQADRIVLTRDRELLKGRAIVHGCYVHALDPEQQLRELFARLDLAPGARPFSLCLHCNLPLRMVDKAGILERLPESVRDLHDSFTTCDSCGRIYWKGSHTKRMAALLDAVAAAQSPPSGLLGGLESPDHTDPPWTRVKPSVSPSPLPIDMPVRVECPPGACVCERARLLADPQADKRPLLLTRQQEQKLIERIERVDSYADLQHVQGLIRRNLGAELRIAPGPNEVRTVRGIVIVLEERPGLCKKVRQSVPAAVRRRLAERLDIAYAILDAHDLFGAS